MRRTIHTDQAPAAVGPYSQAVEAGGWVWVSGQIPLEPATGRLVDGDVEVQTRQVLRNLEAVLREAGCGPEHVVRSTIYLADLRDFETVNRVYGAMFTEAPPARACVEVSALPKGARVEIDAVALAPEGPGRRDR